MKYVVYVLKDESGILYKGLTSNLSKRLERHGKGYVTTTARMKKLEVAYTEEFDTFEDARKREVYFKTAAGRRFLKKKLGPIV